MARTVLARRRLSRYCLFAALLVECTTHSASAQQPTKEETTEYISRKISQHGGGVCHCGRGGSFGWSDLDCAISADGLLTMTWYRSVPGDNLRETQIVPLGALDASTVDIKPYSEGNCSCSLLEMLIWCKHGYCVQTTSRVAKRPHEVREKQSQRLAVFYFPTSREEEANRVAKAFRHLIPLFGGQQHKELFEQ